MKKYFNFLPQTQITISQVADLLKKEKRKKKDNHKSLNLKKQENTQLNVTSPFVSKEKNSKISHASYYSKLPVPIEVKKHETFLRKNDGISKRSYQINKKNFLRQLGEEKIQKGGKKQKNIQQSEKYSYLRKKQNSCEPICGLFSIKCQNCKPLLDCFNSQFEAFLREHNLWILNGSSQQNFGQEEIKQYIIQEIGTFYREQGEYLKQNAKKYQQVQKIVFIKLKDKVVEKLSQFKLTKVKEKQLVNWFQKIYRNFRREFFVKVKFSQEKKGKRQRKTLHNLVLIKNKAEKGNQINSLYQQQKNQRFSSINGLEEMIKVEEKLKRRNKGNRRNSFLKNNERENSNEYLKEKNEQNRIVLTQIKSPEKEKQQQKTMKKILHIQKKMFDEEELNNSKEEQKQLKREGKSTKRVKATNKIILMNKSEIDSSSGRQIQEETEKIEKISSDKKVKLRRRGLIKRIKISQQEKELNCLKKRIQKNMKAMKTVEKYLDQIQNSQLKIKETDSALTLSRKYRYLKSIQPQYDEVDENFQSYLTMIKDKIQYKIKKQNKVIQHDKQGDQSKNIMENDEKLIRRQDVLKSLNFYDLFGVQETFLKIPSFQNKNYIKSLCKESYIDHEIKRNKWKIQIPQFLLEEKEMESPRRISEESILVQKSLEEAAIENKLNEQLN